MGYTLRASYLVAPLCAMLAVAGCGISDALRELRSLKDQGIDDGAAAGASATAEAVPDSELLLELKTGASLRVPVGAVDAQVSLSIRRPKDAEAEALVRTLARTDKLASAPYVFTPHGTQFKRDVEVTLPISGERDLEALVVAWLEDEQDTNWKTLGTPIVEGGLARIALDHFSVLVLLERGVRTGDTSDDGYKPTPVPNGTDGGDDTDGDDTDGDGQDSAREIVDSSLCDDCQAGQHCLRNRYEDEVFYTCKTPCAQSADCGAGSAECSGPSSLRVVVSSCSSGYCEYGAFIDECTDTEGNTSACVENACTSTPPVSLPYGIVDATHCGGCSEDLSCFHIKAIDVPSIFRCHRPCEKSDECPSTWENCAGPNARAYDVPSCGSLGYCEFNPVTVPCEDDQGNPTSCMNGKCQFAAK